MKNNQGRARIAALLVAGMAWLTVGQALAQSAPVPSTQPLADKPAEAAPSAKPDVKPDATKKPTSTGKDARKKEPPTVKVATVVSASNSLQHEAPCDRCKGSGKETKSKSGPPKHVAPGISQRDTVLFGATCDACEGLKVDKADKMAHIVKELVGALDKVDTQQREWNTKLEQIGNNLTKAALIGIPGWAQRLQGYRHKVQSKEFKDGDAVLLAGVVESDEGTDAQRVLTIKIGSAVNFGNLTGKEKWYVVPDASISSIRMTEPRIVKAGAGSPVLFGGTVVRDSDGTISLRRGFAVRGN